jgi:cysteinyl-tRNA synthetase
MGGVEHKSIHHPNEIAQSETAHGTTFAHYWLHNEHLTVDDRKMSKSEGTGFSLQEIKEKGFDPMDLRYLFLQAHYRSKQNFTWKALEAARASRKELIASLRENPNKGQILENYKKQFQEAIENDVNIPNALAVLWKLLRSKERPEDKSATILDFDKVFGLNLKSALSAKGKKLPAQTVEKIEDLIKKREEARNAKNFAKSDEIRGKLKSEFNIEIEDTPSGTKWKFINN